jgi:hypothetical protein
MRFPPLTNATLTRVAEDTQDDSGTVKWTGSASVFVSDREVTADDGQVEMIVVERSLVADDALAVEWARGDVLTYSYRGDVLQSVVRTFRVSSATGLPGAVRLTVDSIPTLGFTP